jgi:phosphoglycolate phosphatase
VARLIVLDLDGTLVDSSRDIADAVNAALRRLAPQAPPLPLARVMSFVGEGARLLVERTLADARMALDVDRVLAAYLECYRERLLATTVLYPGMDEALDALARGGTTLAVLSNKPGDMSRAILEGLGVGPRFARILGAGDVTARKPDPAGLLALLGELGIQAEQAWLVGDSATDVRTARAASVRVAGAAWGFDPAGLRAAGPDRLLAHPGELPELVTD